MQQTIRLVRGADGQAVEAVLLDLTQQHLDDYETLWREQLSQSEQEDKFWDWEFKRRLFLKRENYEGYAIASADRTEGLMIIETQQHRSQITPGQPLVYIEALATAPWNRPAISRPPELRGVGTALLLFARQRSLQLGYGGRVGLYALPRAERFYENQHISRFDPDPDDYPDREDKPLTYFGYAPMRLRGQ
jgi:GNAT superfamily N-acetyltransferase